MRLKTYLQKIINETVELTNDDGSLSEADVKMIVKKGKTICFLINEKMKIVAKRKDNP